LTSRCQTFIGSMFTGEGKRKRDERKEAIKKKNEFNKIER
jgi:hypothetical protein